MVVTRKPWVGGNWKCNGTMESIDTLCKLMEKSSSLSEKVDVFVCPSTIHMSYVAQKLPKNMICSQNVSATSNGAFTGETSAEMLKDFGFGNTLIGHSERRTRYGDTDEVVAAKVEICQKVGINHVICIGETLSERENNQTFDVLQRQMVAVIPKITDWSKVVVAYEPVWAIGTGKVATTEQAQEAHAAVRKMLKEKVNDDVAANTRIVYGGSVTPENAPTLVSQPDVDGFLVGGASLKPGFDNIISSLIPKA